jgi:ADP-ribose pyrophosphatase
MKTLRAWKTLDKTLILDRSPWMRLYSDRIELPDGRVIDEYLRIEALGYVMIVPVDNTGRIGFVRSYKRGLDEIDLQPPAGLLEVDEEPLVTARRELLEELGCVAEQWESIGKFISSGNYGAGYAHLFLATGCRQAAKPDSGDLEEQEVIWLPVDAAREKWRTGEFHQLSSTAALGLAFARLDARHDE